MEVGSPPANRSAIFRLVPLGFDLITRNFTEAVSRHLRRHRRNFVIAMLNRQS